MIQGTESNISPLRGQRYSVITVKTSATWWRGIWCWLVQCLADDASPVLAPCHGHSRSAATNVTSPSQYKQQTVHHLNCAEWATVNSGKTSTKTHVYEKKWRLLKCQQIHICLQYGITQKCRLGNISHYSSLVRLFLQTVAPPPPPSDIWHDLRPPAFFSLLTVDPSVTNKTRFYGQHVQEKPPKSNGCNWVPPM
jgi:hypothetical protein